jgi:hypothetical protein
LATIGSSKRPSFDGGVRLFAVGDADQSVYGFSGADNALLLYGGRSIRAAGPHCTRRVAQARLPVTIKAAGPARLKS